MFMIIIDQLNPNRFDIIMDEFFKIYLLSDKNNPSKKIEIYFIAVSDGKANNAYPKFEHRFNTLNNSILIKAEIAGHLYLHYMHNDIEDEYIDYVIILIN